MGLTRLLTLGSSNAKTAKGEAYGVLTGILHLAPERASGFNVCAYAGACVAPCLNTSGRGRPETPLGARIQSARLRKTARFFSDRDGFMRDLCRDVSALVRKAKRRGMLPAVRLNGTSDIPWERIPVDGAPHIFAAFPDVTFYDYTKWPVARRLVLPANYHLTQSLDVGLSSEVEALTALSIGRNVAAVFPIARSKPLPETFKLGASTFPVINGDASDLRFTDPRGVIVGLRAKGRAKHDQSGFVREVA